MTDYATLFADWLTEKSRQEAHDRFIAQILPWRETSEKWGYSWAALLHKEGQ